MKTSTQVRLRKGNIEQVSWIPSKFAVKGKFLKLKEEDGWEVVEVYNTMDSKYVNERSRDHKQLQKVLK